MLLFLVGCKENSNLSENSNIQIAKESSNLSESPNIETIKEDAVFITKLKAEDFTNESIPHIKSYTTSRKESNILSEDGKPLKQIYCCKYTFTVYIY